jgi:hypothetical protein
MIEQFCRTFRKRRIKSPGNGFSSGQMSPNEKIVPINLSQSREIFLAGHGAETRRTGQLQPDQIVAALKSSDQQRRNTEVRTACKKVLRLACHSQPRRNRGTENPVAPLHGVDDRYSSASGWDVIGQKEKDEFLLKVDSTHKAEDKEYGGLDERNPVDKLELELKAAVLGPFYG